MQYLKRGERGYIEGGRKEEKRGGTKGRIGLQ